MLKTLTQKMKGSLLYRIRRFGGRLNFTRKIKVNNANIKIPHIGGMSCTITEPWMIGLLKMFLQNKNGAFIDVGINVGQTLVKLKSVRPDIQYIGFEPNPYCLYYLDKLINKNNFTNCSIIPVGLYTEDKVLALNLYSDEATDSSASLIEHFRSSNKIIKRVFVPAFRFNSVTKLLDLDSISIVKIDVEGAELEVIKSLLNMIKKYRPVILLEILPAYRLDNTVRISRQDEIENIFKSIDYVFYRVKKEPVESFSLVKIDTIGVHSDLEQCDYVVAPAELPLTHWGK